MTQQTKVPRVWELLKLFKETCRGRGWKTSDYEDLVKIGDEYHSFIGARTTHPSTFKRITSSKKCSIPDGKSYSVVNVSYTAWVFQQPPSKQLLDTLTTDSDLSRKTALYDLSKIYRGEALCLKLNETGSRAFCEFERFLKETYGVEVKPLYEPQTNEPRTFKSKLLKASSG